MGSQGNLRALHHAVTCYARDWNDRQFTGVPDDLGVAGGSCATYEAAFGYWPLMYAGWSCDGSLYSYGWSCFGNQVMQAPINFDGVAAGVGVFRIPNVRGLHDYVNGRVYDPVYYSPLDVKAWDTASAFFDIACELAAVDETNGLIVPASYALSPAAMYDPAVLAPPSAGGFRDPDSFEDGYRAPAVRQAAFPALKTWMIEHNWLRNPPGACHPDFGDPLGGYAAGCDPYLFNHGASARPVALFFDGSIERLHTGAVARADRLLIRRTGDGLWARDTPLGEDGYFGEFADDDTRVSHHVLTIDGILGRDRIP